MQNTLKTIAAKFNLYQLTDIDEKIKVEYEHRVKYGHKEIPTELTKMQGIEVGLFYECKDNYINHSYILLKAANSDIILMLQQNRQDKYYLDPYYSIIHKYSGISYHLKGEALKQIKEPNLIGVFNEKKVNQWIDYCNQYIEIHEQLLNTVNDANKANEDKVNTFIASLNGKCSVSEYGNKVNVKTDLFYVTFEYFKDQKYMSTNIRFEGNIQDITTITNNQ